MLLVGVVGNNVLGKRLVRQGRGRTCQSVPVFRTIYSPVRQLLAAFSPDNESGLKRVAMVPDGCGGFRLGFVTKEFTADVDGERRPLVAVYVPTNHLYLGDVFICHRDGVVFPDISVQDGVRIFLTGGMAIAGPSGQPARRDAGSATALPGADAGAVTARAGRAPVGIRAAGFPIISGLSCRADADDSRPGLSRGRCSTRKRDSAPCLYRYKR